MSQLVLGNPETIKSTVSNVLEKFYLGYFQVPEFQRRYQYKDSQRNNLITSLLIGISIDSFTCVKEKEKLWLCDGLHRMNTIRSFINNEWPYSFTDSLAKRFGVSEEFDGKYYKDLPEETKIKLLNRPIDIVVLEASSPSRVNELMLAVMRAKNSSAVPIGNSQLKLNDTLREDKHLLSAWSRLMNGFKCKSFSTMRINRVLNSSSLSEAFNFVNKQVGDSVRMNRIVEQVLSIDLSQAVNDSQLSSWLQGSLLKSYFEELTGKEIDTKTFLQIHRDVRNATQNHLNPSFKILAILYSITLPRNMYITESMKRAMQILLINQNSPLSIEMKQNITQYLG